MSAVHHSSIFWLLRVGEAVYLLCSRVTLAVVTWLFLQHHMAPLASSALAVFFAARLLAGGLLSWVTDAVSRRTLLRGLGGVAAFSIGILVWADPVTALLPAFLSLSLLGAVDSLFTPVVNACIPEVVHPDALESAYRYAFFLQALVNTAGMAIGLAGFQLFHQQWIFLTALVLLAVVTITLGGLPKLAPAPTGMKSSVSIRGLLRPFRTFLGFRLEVVWALISLLTNVFTVTLSSLVIPYHIGRHLHKPPLYVGLIEASAALGAIVAALWLQKRLSKHLARPALVTGSFLVLSGCFLFYALFPAFIAWLLISFVVGLAIVTNNTTVEAARSIAIPKGIRGQIQTLHYLLIQAGVPVGLFACGRVLEHQDARLWLWLSSGVVLLLALSLFYNRDLQLLLRTPKQQLDGLYSRLYACYDRKDR